jgi:hypothetical protein
VDTGWTVGVRFPEAARIPLLSSGNQGLFHWYDAQVCKWKIYIAPTFYSNINFMKKHTLTKIAQRIMLKG